MARGRYTAYADISDFYGSLYTHSIEWALESKQVAKKNIGKKSAGGALDTAIRNEQEGQTKGIPVGPDTSLLASELVLCALDFEMQKVMPQTATSAIRFADDVEFFAETLSEAERFLVNWDRLLHSYGLSLNPRKTKIVEGSDAHEQSWAIELRQFRFRADGSDRVLSNDIQSFFARAFSLARTHRDDPVLSYAIRTAGSLELGAEAWSKFEFALLASATTDPSCLRIVSDQLLSAHQGNVDINREGIAECLNRLCEYHAPLEHGSEVTWALYILLRLKLKLRSSAARLVSAMSDNCSGILLLELRRSGLIFGRRPEVGPIYERAARKDAPFSPNWLLGYELARLGEISAGAFANDVFWGHLLDKKVVFFCASFGQGAMPSAQKPNRVNLPRLPISQRKKNAKTPRAVSIDY